MLNKLCRILARSDIFFYALIWLMLLLIAGTIAEEQQGLYYAQQNYFSVYFFLLFGFIPLPGTYTTLTLIFINLLAKLAIDKWHKRKLGTLVTHISGLLLLLGGFLTAHFSHEGFIELKNQEPINYYNDYNNLELVITNKTNNNLKSTKLVTTHDINTFLNIDKIPFKLKLIDYCRHCELSHGKLTKLPKPKDNQQPQTIIAVDIYNTQSLEKINNATIYIELDHIDHYKLEINNKTYTLALRHQEISLPFSITLRKFTPEMHPGTEIAKSYDSDVTLNDHENNISNWHSKISMNNPLRYKGYTLYQSSYYIENNQYVSVLAAVYNTGQSFPYIASIILCIGILLHLFQRVPKLIK